MWVSLDDEWILGGIGVKGDTADDSRVGDLLAVLLGLDGRVEQIPQQCQAEAEQQTEHHAEGQVARRLGADRRGGDGGALTTVTFTGLDWPLATLSRSVTVLVN